MTSQRRLQVIGHSPSRSVSWFCMWGTGPKVMTPLLGEMVIGGVGYCVKFTYLYYLLKMDVRILYLYLLTIRILLLFI